jgi:ubiquinol oxidase
MNCSRSITATALPTQSAAHLLRALNNGKITTASTRPAFICLQQQCTSTPFSRRQFSTSKPALIKEFFPQTETKSIRFTEPAWHHPVYTYEQMEAVKVAHRNAKSMSDKVALGVMRLLRWGLDLASGYKHDLKNAVGADGKPKTNMTERKWLIR